ncbi:MAG: type II toxin-antitoxin system VapC family toxin [Planctomycetaceae bacterium]|nr:type II toxin-antitoxin system VapC family toxin [Planctomycetales bacterium]MCB9874982.1 type II toxin-antitoxin system VapC family toxin [Planctomycetaceae bacterium]
MKPKAYIETTVISYLTAWPSRDVVLAGHQQITRDWWQTAADRFELVASELVIAEVGAGDPVAARDRLAALASVTLLDATEQALELATQLLDSGAIPKKAAEDAAHIAIAVTNGVEYLVTWNCRHIANATMRSQIELACRKAGFEPAIICTPDELMEPDNDNE